LAPDWRLSRLVRDGCDEEIGGGGRDEFIDVHVQRPPVEPVKKAWRDKPSQKDVDAAVKGLAQAHSSGSLTQGKIWAALKPAVPGETRKQTRGALRRHAPQLTRPRGRPRKYFRKIIRKQNSPIFFAWQISDYGRTRAKRAERRRYSTERPAMSELE